MTSNASAIDNAVLTNTANAIRTKKNTSGNIKAANFPYEISTINTDLNVSGTKNISANGTYDVSSYEFASVNVPGTGESKIEIDITNNIPNTDYYIIDKDISYWKVYDSNNYTIKSFDNRIDISIFPKWGYRWSYREINDHDIIATLECSIQSQTNYGAYGSQGLRAWAIQNGEYWYAYPTSIFNFALYTNDDRYGIPESLTFSGSATVEPIPSLTVFDTTGLTKTWTGTLTYTNGTLKTNNTYPYYSWNMTPETTDLGLSFTVQHPSMSELSAGGRGAIIEFNDPMLVNKKAIGMSTAIYIDYPENMGHEVETNTCYIQIGNIFFNFIPDWSHNFYIPANCAIETFIEFLQANFINEGDSLPIYRWDTAS